MGTILHQNSHGVKMIREDFKKRSLVKVIAEDNAGTICFKKYRFNLIPEPINIPFCSWANLDCCGGWVYDRDYLNTAVQKGLKLFAEDAIRLKSTLFPDAPTAVEAIHQVDVLATTLAPDIYAGFNSDSISRGQLDIFICRTGCIADYISLDKVFYFYERLGLPLTPEERSEIEQYCHIELKEFGTPAAPFLYSGGLTPTQFITTGLLLGYPIESTVATVQL